MKSYPWAQLLEHATDALLGQCVLVAGLRGRQHIEVVAAFVANQRLVEIGLLIDDIDEIVDDAPLASHDEIQVAQTDIEIDDDRAMTALRQSHSQRGGRGRLADPALARGDHNNSRQSSRLQNGMVRRPTLRRVKVFRS